MINKCIMTKIDTTHHVLHVTYGIGGHQAPYAADHSNSNIALVQAQQTIKIITPLSNTEFPDCQVHYCKAKLRFSAAHTKSLNKHDELCCIMHSS